MFLSSGNMQMISDSLYDAAFTCKKTQLKKHRMTQNTVTRTVEYNGIPITYDLERKRVKNINLRIRSDCSVYVSANIWQSLTGIDSFVKSKGKYILSCQKHFKELLLHKPGPKQYVSGEIFYILGNEVKLQVKAGSPEGIFYDGIHIVLTAEDAMNFKRKQKLMTTFIDTQCKTLFAEISGETYPAFKKYGIPKPAIRIRTMKTRWGTCAVNNGIITLNKQLIEMPRSCIEYVMLHEYCHFLQPNHSNKFYTLVTRFMPDWKERKKLLEKQLPVHR